MPRYKGTNTVPNSRHFAYEALYDIANLRYYTQLLNKTGIKAASQAVAGRYINGGTLFAHLPCVIINPIAKTPQL